MKLIVIACLVVLAAARPDKDAETTLDERDDSGDGNFNYKFETSNGIYEERSGVPGAEGQSNIEGVYRFTLSDGTVGEVRFIADETGYHPVSNLNPTPHPLPEHAIQQIAFAEEQRAKGVVFEK
ncbi:cuticle protein AMP1B [Cherax quadricarinatus]|uniref:cuticle protein AMP1B n=1 Tax=Cherax quadricarinatus TaxID=27406 RepID=UPI002377D5BC|nr:cuticle protein AMP1B-like [Cherax quadricarinatus]